MQIVYASDEKDLAKIKDKILSFIRDNGANASLVISLPKVAAKDLKDQLKTDLGRIARVRNWDQTAFVLDFVRGSEVTLYTWDASKPEAEVVNVVYIYPREFHQRGVEATEHLKESITKLQRLAQD